jgi:RNA polymerase sigma-70 factor (ECF subfamily)
MAIDDATLVLRYQLGDALALDSLVARHQAKAYQYAFRLTRDADLACDVVGEAFVRICKSLRNFRGQSAFTTWLYRIITNCFLDIRKKMASRPSISLETALLTDDGEIERQTAGNCPNPQATVERNEREGRLCAAIEQLPEGYRSIIVLFHVEMLSYDEITEVLNLPIGTVKSRLNRARLALRVLLDQDQELLVAA